MGCVGIHCPDAWAVDTEELFVRDTIELCKTVGFPLMVFEGVPYVSPQLERLVALVRADERAAPVQPMAHIVGEIDHAGKVWKPAQRPWFGLTDEEVAKIVDEQTTDNQGYDIWCDGQGVARAIEAKLKERNNA
jgi:hypothetical protein